jgi:predicted ribosome-associated RNA-binding protein Tma20
MRNGLLIGILILIATNLAFAQKKEIKKIKKSYNTYKDAILNDKSELAIQCIDKRTIAYYDSLLVWVKTADSAKLETYSFF